MNWIFGNFVARPPNVFVQVVCVFFDAKAVNGYKP
jgi:hypothetical protein